jgi:hypothetical protein
MGKKRREERMDRTGKEKRMRMRRDVKTYIETDKKRREERVDRTGKKRRE